MRMLSWLLNHLLFGQIMMFAAGAVADLGLGGGSESVQETTSDGAGDGTSSEVVEDGTSGTDSEGQSADAELAKPHDSTDEESQGDGRALPAEWKKLIADLKPTNPKLASEIRNLKFGHQAFRTEFPGGLKEVRELKQTLDEIGGKEGIQERQAELEQWRAVDEEFINGSPAFIDRIAQNEPESFAKIMPHAINKYADADPEGYQRVLSGVFDATLKNSGVRNTLYLAKQNLSLGKTDEAIKLLDSIDQWADSLAELAKSAPKTKESDPRQAELDKRAEELKNKEAQIFNQSLTAEFMPFRKSAIEKELKNQKALLPNVKVDPEKMEIFEERVIRKIATVNDASPDYKKTFNKYYEAGDKEGLLKFIKERFQKALPDAVKHVSRILPLGGTPAPKKPAANGNQPQKAAPTGFERVAQAPRPDEIDHSKTSFDMKYHSQAILKNGKKVTWAQV